MNQGKFSECKYANGFCEVAQTCALRQQLGSQAVTGGLTAEAWQHLTENTTNMAQASNCPEQPLIAQDIQTIVPNLKQ